MKMLSILFALMTVLCLAAGPTSAADLEGQVLGGGAPIANSKVTVWLASDGAPRQLVREQTDAKGRFFFDIPSWDTADNLYLVAMGGVPTANKASGDNPAIALITVLGSARPAKVTINEMTTIASVWTHTQFLDGAAIKGHALGLRIAAGNVPNFVDLETGGYGTTIQDAINSTQTPTMANFATLASILAGCVTQVNEDACSKVFAAATPPADAAPTDTLAAAQSIARYPWNQPDKLFALLDVFYPVPQGGYLRPTPFMPYLSWAPSAWVLPLKFTGGGLCAPGKIMFDSKGNLWAGDNWIVGAQNQDALWDGNLSKFAPNGKPLSPMTFGFTGGGLGGIGFGLAIAADDSVWGTTYASRTIVHFDNDGNPLSPPQGYNFDGELGKMQGIIVAPNKDIWSVGIAKNQLVHFPGGDPSKGKLLNPESNPMGLAFPFSIAIDQRDRIWVGNGGADYVTRFPASDPSKVERFKTGNSIAGMAVDSQGNVWIASRFGSSERAKETLKKMLANPREFDPILARAMAVQEPGPEGGSITVLRPDGTEAPFSPISGKGLAGPWGIAIDGNDNVWVSNFVSNKFGIVHLCGARPENCPPGMKPGDAISPPGGYLGGGMQMSVDLQIGPAGDVWVSNNWQDYKAALGRVAEPQSTHGAGNGLTVFYGMANPVRTPLIGPVRQPQK